MTYLIYHRMDLDGFCSLAIAKDFLGWYNAGVTYTEVGYHYGDDIDFTQFKDADTFIFMDVFPSPYEEMYERFANISSNIVVLDHHKTFLESSVPNKVSGIMTTEWAGCELAWQWFNPLETIPFFVSLLGRYDRWDNSRGDWETVVLPFQYGAKLALSNPETDIDTWRTLFHTQECRYILDMGETIQKYEASRNKKVLSSNFFTGMFEGLRVIACNDGSYNSQLFDSMWDETKYDAMLAFCIRSNGMLSVSLYATDDAIDCTPIAKNFGGGGHKHACGFSISVLEFFSLFKMD